MKNSPVLITGITGYIGSNLAKALVEQGCRVAGIVRASSDLSQIKSIIDKVELFNHEGDIVELTSFIQKLNPGVVFHLASCFIVQHKLEQIETLINSNLLFATQLVDAMRQAGVKKLINTGTSWQHFNNETYNPTNLYAATKEAFYTILRYYYEACEFQIINLELFDTYGPNDPRSKLIKLLFSQINNSTILDMSPGEQLIDLVYIEDVVSAFIAAWKLMENQSLPMFKTYSVTTNHPIKVKELIALFEKVIGRKINVNLGGRAYRNREVMTYWQGCQLSEWEAKVRLEDGLRKILETN